ncbi:UNVERIFIED_CONTAM: hypothetical protein Sindi_2121300 [Sesamum indicum]
MRLAQEEIPSQVRPISPRGRRPVQKCQAQPKKEAHYNRFSPRGEPARFNPRGEPATPKSVRKRSLSHPIRPKKEAQYKGLLHPPKANSREGWCPQETELLSLRGLVAKQESSLRGIPSSSKNVLSNQEEDKVIPYPHIPAFLLGTQLFLEFLRKRIPPL